MERTLAETIKEITRKHVEENNGLVMGQCLSAVGWVNNTVPDTKNIIEFPMIDVAEAGIAVGAAVVGRRPILVIRFQDFLFLNASMIINYAAKTNDIFKKGTPIFVRLLATEGRGTGPVHSGVLHSIFMHMPGFRVVCPITPKEYNEIWEDFMSHNSPMIVSEHRASFNQIEEMKNIIYPDADITLFGISNARFRLLEAAEILKKEGIKCNIIHLYWLKPLLINNEMINSLKQTKLGLIVDPDFEMVGASQSIAYELMHKTGMAVHALGAKDKSVGAAARFENTTPKIREIIEKIQKLVRVKREIETYRY